MRSKQIVVVMTASAVLQAGSTTASRALVSTYNRASAKLAEEAFVISSGLRFVRFSDDPGTITLAKRYQSDASGAKANLQNSNQGSSLVQVADQGLTSINDLLSNAKTLVTDAQTGLYNDRQLAEINVTLADYLNQINTIVTNTTFNDLTLLDGSVNSTFAVSKYGAGTSTITLTISAANTTRLFPGGALNVRTPAAAATSLTAVTNAQSLLQQTIADVGAYGERFDEAANVAASTLGGLNGAADGLLNADIPTVTNQQKIDEIRHNAAAALIAQGGRLSTSLLKLV